MRLIRPVFQAFITTSITMAAFGILAVVQPAEAMPPLPKKIKSDAMVRGLEYSAAAKQVVQIDENGERVLPLILEGSVTTQALEAAGISVGTDAGGFRTIRVPESRMAALVNLPGITRLSMGMKLRPQLTLSVGDINANDKRTSSPPLLGWNGKDVIVGIVDTGVDYDHDDFKNPDGTTRILSIWDQNNFGTPPTGFGYGNECSEAQINVGSCGQQDPAGHGTHVTGIAAGDGSATGNGELPFKYIGMANNANIIVVATDFSFGGVVDGANYIFQRAASLGMPAVVNMSLGTEIGPHDGSMSWEQQLDALTGPGKIIVTSAGNAQDDDVHASANIVASADSFHIPVAVYVANSGTGNDFIATDTWHASANSYAVRVRTPDGTVVGPVTQGTLLQTDTNDGRVIIDYRFINEPNGQDNIYIEVNDEGGTPPDDGNWFLVFHPISVPASSIVHTWMVSSLGGQFPAFPFFATHVDANVNIGTPGTATQLVTVTSHTTRRTWFAIDGGTYNFSGAVNPPNLSPYSAFGPRRDGVLKPDISAPGSAIWSVLSSESSPPYPLALVNNDGVHLILQGTSMSAPHVTGGIAMLLQNDPTLTPAQVKTLIANGARSDGTTGSVPNDQWGNGRFDLADLLCDLDLIDPVASIIWPVPPGDTLYAGTKVAVSWSVTDNTGAGNIIVDYRDGTLDNWTTLVTNGPPMGNVDFDVPGTITDSLEFRVRGYDCLDNEGTGTSGLVSVVAPSVPVIGSDLPIAFASHGPTPNPFSDQSIIRFDLPAAPSGGQWPVHVSLYNVAGRKVRTLVQGDLPPGRYSYEWDGRDANGTQLSAGIYFLVISAGANSARERLIYLK